MNAHASEIISHLKIDCLHFRGDRPCGPHTRSGSTCECGEYSPIHKRGVIVKLGAAGDVLRTTPLLRAVREHMPNTHITFVTHSPELIPVEAAEAVRPASTVLERLRLDEWNFCWNLDKDMDACVIAEIVRTEDRKGFILHKGIPYPANDAAWHKYATGVDDAYSKSNRLSYVQEIFDIVGLPFRGEEYWLNSPIPEDRDIAEKLFPGDEWIGLNTGAGHRWPTRLWPEDRWINLVKLLQGNGYMPLILGGPEEKALNERLSLATGCPHSGLQSLGVFNAIIHKCRLVVTSVTQAMHLAIGARRPLVLFNNIFNPHEFELYGRGQIIQPDNACDCFYSPVCKTGRNCMSEISPQRVFQAIRESLPTGQ